MIGCCRGDTVPGGSDGPSGLLLCCENYLIYKNIGDQPDVRCPIPRRQNDLDDAERGMLFVCAAMHKTKVTEYRVHVVCRVLTKFPGNVFVVG